MSTVPVAPLRGVSSKVALKPANSSPALRLRSAMFRVLSVSPGLTEIGLGSNRLGEEGVLDEDWDRLARRAIDLGVNVFDTAERYASGRSEEVLGRVVGNTETVLYPF